MAALRVVWAVGVDQEARKAGRRSRGKALEAEVAEWAARVARSALEVEIVELDRAGGAVARAVGPKAAVRQVVPMAAT